MTVVFDTVLGGVCLSWFSRSLVPQKPPSEVVKQVAGLDPRPRPRSPRRAGIAGEWDGEGREERLAFDCPVEWKPSNQ